MVNLFLWSILPPLKAIVELEMLSLLQFAAKIGVAVEFEREQLVVVVVVCNAYEYKYQAYHWVSIGPMERASNISIPTLPLYLSLSRTHTNAYKITVHINRSIIHSKIVKQK